MHFVVFNDMKSKYFSNALRYSRLYVISSIRQPVAQELDKIHVLHARRFCTRLRLNVWWCTSETCKYKNAIIKAATMTTLITAMLAAKGILQKAYIKYRDFNKGSCMKVLRANGGFHSK